MDDVTCKDLSEDSRQVDLGTGSMTLLHLLYPCLTSIAKLILYALYHIDEAILVESMSRGLSLGFPGFIGW